MGNHTGMAMIGSLTDPCGRVRLQAHADGYTVTVLTSSTAISVPLFKKLGYDPLKDFVPISSLGFFDCVFVSISFVGVSPI